MNNYKTFKQQNFKITLCLKTLRTTVESILISEKRCYFVRNKKSRI